MCLFQRFDLVSIFALSLGSFGVEFLLILLFDCVYGSRVLSAYCLEVLVELGLQGLNGDLMPFLQPLLLILQLGGGVGSCCIYVLGNRVSACI